MSTPHRKYLLLGAGLASASAAQAIRAIDQRGELTLIGQEHIGPYIRPPLSKQYLRQRMARKELFTHEPSWYADHGVELRTGSRASHIDTARHIVALESGEEIGFDKLLIATGLSPIHLHIPGADLPGIYYLRTADDADRIHNATEKARKEGTRHDRGHGRVAVIGGGILGVELAATLTQLGLAVDLFISRPHPWFKFAGETTGKFIARYLEKNDVTVHCNAAPRALEGDGRIQRVITSDGAIACDFAVAAVGAAFNREILRGTPIRCEKQILVDAHCRTNVPGIYAAGDCAAIFDPLFGKHRVLEHFDGAQTLGTLAGTNMAGAEKPYDAVNFFDSQLFDLKLKCWGESRVVDRRLVRVKPSDPNDQIEFGIAADNRIAQIIAINHDGEDDSLRSLIANRTAVNGNEESLKDPAFAISNLLI